MMNSVSETTAQAASRLHKNACVHTPHIHINMHIHKIIFSSQKESQPAYLPVLSGLFAHHPTHLLPFSYLYGSKNNMNLSHMGKKLPSYS